MKEQLIQMVKEMVGHEFLYFDSPIEVKPSPHILPVRAWAMCVSPKDDIFIMDPDEEWHQVTKEQEALTIPTLFQRISLMEKHFKSKTE